jgi:hypothetical protein
VQEVTVRIVMQHKNRAIPPAEIAILLIEADFTANFSD